MSQPEPKYPDRHTYLGCSELGAACGLSEYDSPQDIRDYKALRRVPQHKSIFERGNEMESTIKRMVAERFGIIISGEQTEFKGTGRVDFLRAHVDGMIEQEFQTQAGESALASLLGVTPLGLGLAEFKSPGSRMAWQYKHDGLPPDYVAQVQGQMALAGAAYCIVFLLDYDAWDLITIPVFPNPVLVEAILDTAADFWSNRLNDEWFPEPVKIEKDQPRGHVVAMEDDPICRVFAAYVGLKDAIKEAEADEKANRAEIEQWMQERKADTAEFPDGTLSWKQAAGAERIDGKAAVAWIGELVASLDQVMAVGEKGASAAAKLEGMVEAWRESGGKLFTSYSAPSRRFVATGRKG